MAPPPQEGTQYVNQNYQSAIGDKQLYTIVHTNNQ